MLGGGLLQVYGTDYSIGLLNLFFFVWTSRYEKTYTPEMFFFKGKMDMIKSQKTNFLLRKVKSAVQKGGFDLKLNKELAALQQQFRSEGLSLDSFNSYLLKLKVLFSSLVVARTEGGWMLHINLFKIARSISISISIIYSFFVLPRGNRCLFLSL